MKKISKKKPIDVEPNPKKNPSSQMHTKKNKIFFSVGKWKKTLLCLVFFFIARGRGRQEHCIFPYRPLREETLYKLFLFSISHEHHAKFAWPTMGITYKTCHRSLVQICPFQQHILQKMDKNFFFQNSFFFRENVKIGHIKYGGP